VTQPICSWYQELFVTLYRFSRCTKQCQCSLQVIDHCMSRCWAASWRWWRAHNWLPGWLWSRKSSWIPDWYVCM